MTLKDSSTEELRTDGLYVSEILFLEQTHLLTWYFLLWVYSY